MNSDLSSRYEMIRWIISVDNDFETQPTIIEDESCCLLDLDPPEK